MTSEKLNIHADIWPKQFFGWQTMKNGQNSKVFAFYSDKMETYVSATFFEFEDRSILPRPVP